MRGDELPRDRVPVRAGLQPGGYLRGVPQLPREARGARQLLGVRLLRGGGEEAAASTVTAAAGWGEKRPVSFFLHCFIRKREGGRGGGREGCAEQDRAGRDMYQKWDKPSQSG